MQFPSVQSLAFAYGGPGAQGQFKLQTDDFIVEEFLPFQPEGQGEHSFLYIEKCHENTEYVARVLARHAGVRQRDIGFAGLKDRHGRTRQWFSVWLPGKPDPDWQALNSEQLQILSVTRHPRKLKRGVLAGNRFQIRIRHWQGDVDQTHQQLKL
ncbi:MAG: tRNA pseudouridine(13) synthase TruD, partial [Methylococcaceae bacterium]|nr:tRNA pseudouridine(13) synthase TruD [Methylococcaceae bacterium]